MLNTPIVEEKAATLTDTFPKAATENGAALLVAKSATGQQIAIGRIALALGIVMAVVWHLWSLMRWPEAFVDEGWFANRAWAWVQTGQPFGTIDHPIIEQYPHAADFYPLLQSVIQGTALQIFGLRLESLRLASLLAGLLLLVVLWNLAVRIGGKRVGWITAFLLLFSIPFTYSAHLGRADIFVALLGTTALSLAMATKVHTRKGIAMAALAGGLVGLGLDIHPISAISMAPLFVVLAADSGWRPWRDARIWAAGAGFAAGVLMFAALHILPDPASYSAISAIVFSSERIPALFDLGVWGKAFLETTVQISVALGTWSVLVLFAIIDGIRRGPRGLTLGWLAHLAALILISRTPRLFYAIFLTPVAVLILALWLDRLFQVGWARRLQQALPRTLALGVLLAGFLYAPLMVAKDSLSDYTATLTAERAAIAPGSVVIGTASHWFGLVDENFMGWESLVYHHRLHPDQDLDAAMTALQPDFFILDDWVELFLVDGERLPDGDMLLHLPREGLMSYLSEHGTLVKQLDTVSFGKVRIYKLDRRQAATNSSTK